jgi:hypothetical protein
MGSIIGETGKSLVIFVITSFFNLVILFQSVIPLLRTLFQDFFLV